MTADEFILTSPCLEEVSGFLQGLPGLPTVLTKEERDKVDTYREHLLEGKVVPDPSSLKRSYIYRFGKRPAKIKKPLP